MRPGQILDIVDKGEIVAAVVLRREGERIIVQTEGGRTLVAHEEQIADAPEGLICAPGEDAQARLGEHRALITQERVGLDLASLWERLVDEGAPRALAALVPLAFSEETAARRGALLRALADDSTYFQRRHDGFWARSRAEVGASLGARARDEEESKQRAEFVEWLTWVRREEGLPSSRSLSPAPPPPEGSARWLDVLAGYAISAETYERALLARELLAEAGFSVEQRSSSSAFQILVRAGRFGRDENLLLHRYSWRQKFSPAIEEEADRAALRLRDVEGRADFIGELLYTIDDPDTQEVDDAIGLLKRLPGGGFRIGVHIADPDHFVRRDERLDIEAQRRGTTLYLPDARFTLFPQKLSEGAMSLGAGKERPALSFLFTIRRDGEVEGLSIRPSEIRVCRRFSYEQADEALYTGGVDGDQLALLLEAAEALRQRRLEAGALSFSSPEVLPRVDEEGEIAVKRTDPTSPSRDLVAELMIATNYATARFFEERGAPAIFRGQAWLREPRGLELPEGHDPYSLYRRAALLGRTELSERPRRHAGLGLPSYVQVTSPIRRYTDLLLHRQLKALISQEPLPYSSSSLWELARAAEKRAGEARRIEAWSKEYWLLRYFAARPGLEATAVVLRELEEGVYQVELLEYTFRTTYRGRRLTVGERLPVVIRGAQPRTGGLLLGPR